MNAEFGSGSPEVRFDRLGGDAHTGGDLAVGEAKARESGGLLFAGGERLPALPEVIALGEGMQASGKDIVGKGVLGLAGLASEGLESREELGIEGELPP